MTGQEILNAIHAVRDASEMASKINGFRSDIRTYLSNDPDGSKSSYYRNHIGRELFRKLYIFNMSHEMGDDHDAGFRPEPPYTPVFTPSVTPTATLTPTPTVTPTVTPTATPTPSGA